MPGPRKLIFEIKKKNVMGSRDIQASASEGEFSNTRAHCDPGFYAGWGRGNYKSKSKRGASRDWEIIRLALARMIFPTQDCTATQDFMQAEPVSIMYRNQKGKLLELGSIQAGGNGDYFPT